MEINSINKSINTCYTSIHSTPFSFLPLTKNSRTALLQCLHRETQRNGKNLLTQVCQSKFGEKICLLDSAKAHALGTRNETFAAAYFRRGNDLEVWNWLDLEVEEMEIFRRQNIAPRDSFESGKARVWYLSESFPRSKIDRTGDGDTRNKLSIDYSSRSNRQLWSERMSAQRLVFKKTRVGHGALFFKHDHSPPLLPFVF